MFNIPSARAPCSSTGIALRRAGATDRKTLREARAARGRRRRLARVCEERRRTTRANARGDGTESDNILDATTTSGEVGIKILRALADDNTQRRRRRLGSRLSSRPANAALWWRAAYTHYTVLIIRYPLPPIGSVVSVSRDDHPRSSTPPGATSSPPRASSPPSPRVSVVPPRRSLRSAPPPSPPPSTPTRLPSPPVPRRSPPPPPPPPPPPTARAQATPPDPRGSKTRRRSSEGPRRRPRTATSGDAPSGSNPTGTNRRIFPVSASSSAWVRARTRTSSARRRA